MLVVVPSGWVTVVIRAITYDAVSPSVSRARLITVVSVMGSPIVQYSHP
jgi:hypothetical protein